MNDMFNITTLFLTTDRLIEWVGGNSEWIFNGIGVAIFTTLVASVYHLYKYLFLKKEKTVDFYPRTQKDKNSKEFDNHHKENDTHIYNGMTELVERFISVYINHGLTRTQISSFLDSDFSFKVSDFMDNNSVTKILDNEILNFTCSTFGIQRDWLDGISKEIYPYINYYKNIEFFIKFIYKFKLKYGKEFRVYLLKSGELDINIDSYVIIIFKYPIKKINNKTIYGYIPISEEWKWSYINTRYQLKTIIYICDRLGVYIDGYDRQVNTIKNIVNCVVFPGPEIDKSPHVDWYPVDYIDLPSESVKAKETFETVDVRKSIAKWYLKYLVDLEFEDYNSCERLERMKKELNEINYL